MLRRCCCSLLPSPSPRALPSSAFTLSTSPSALHHPRLPHPAISSPSLSSPAHRVSCPQRRLLSSTPSASASRAPSAAFPPSPSPSPSPRLSPPSTSPMSTSTAPAGPVAEAITAALTSTFEPLHLEVLNESYMHSVPRGSETHFKVVLVSASFDGQSLIQRHRAVNAALAPQFQQGLHALSIVARTPAQWEQSGGAVSQSPACVGGMKAEAEAKRKQPTPMT